MTVDLQIASEVRSLPCEAEIRSWIASVLDAVPGTRATEVSVRIVDQEESRSLNHRFRGKDKATNVLSFPVVDDVISGLPDAARQSLGDIVVCGPVVEAEAAEQRKPVADHWAHMLVHGTLHLLGYDHEACDDAEVMEAIERRILAAQGVPDPYAT
jgi:probable rRNA maturation factor